MIADLFFNLLNQSCANEIPFGLFVVLGWFVTGLIGADEFDPVQTASLSFVAPVAEGLQFLMTYTGDTLRFGTALVGGTLVGAFISSMVAGRFHYEGFTAELPVWRYVVGGLLMGFGGVTALGCTIGQGLTGVSTAAPSSVLAYVSMIVGGYIALRWVSPLIDNGKKPLISNAAPA